MSQWLDEWKRRDNWRTTRPMQREPGNHGTRRYDDVGPIIQGVPAGMVVENPENLPTPKPEKMVRCVCLTGFCVGQRPDGTVHDAVPGDILELPARRANRLARMQTVEIVPDEIDQRAKASMARAERADRLAQAARIAAGPTPAQPGPPAPEPAPPADAVRLKALKAFSLGNGRDVVAGQVFACDEESARYRIARGLAALVEPERNA